MTSLNLKSFLIRDPVHGYIQIASHERALVDHPITQRLRRINQTGFADLVYPEARTSRFAHSLGAMHLSSRFLISAIENAAEKDAVQFFEELGNLDVVARCKANELDYLLLGDDRNNGGLQSARIVFRHGVLRRHGGKFKRLLGVAEAGLRLAALFHDLGHLPFSHDMEFAFDDFIARLKQKREKVPAGLRALVDGPPHEVVGHALAKLVFKSVPALQRGAVKAACKLAAQILDVPGNFYDQPTPKASVVEWLHSLIDGEVDADRADYLLRDARAFGFEFAIYDLDRLVSNLALVNHRELGFTTAIEERGFSALETFYVSRARSNQNLPRHHKVAQIAAAFRYVAAELLSREETHTFRLVLSSVGALGEPDSAQAEKLLRAFKPFDDSWWFELMQALPSASDVLFRACSELLLDRSQTLRSVWKRKGDLSRTQVFALNSLVSESLTKLSLVRSRLQSRGILLLMHKFRPVRLRSGGSGESLMLVRTANKTLIPVTSHSTLIHSLLRAWNEDIHLHAFQLSSNSSTPDEVFQMIICGA